MRRHFVSILTVHEESTSNKKYKFWRLILYNEGPHNFLESWVISDHSQNSDEVVKVVGASVAKAKDVYNTKCVCWCER